MNLRADWTYDDSMSNRFRSLKETVNEVKENFDLRRLHGSEGKDITINDVTEKCLVQTSSNPLRDLDDQRKIHCPLTMIINRGDYVQYENAIWLITTNVANIDDAYQSARMSMCNWQLKWQNSNSEIILRWAYISSASKYNDGETGNSVITLGSDQLSVEIPIDSESLSIKRETKFFIDNNGSDPTVYELTGTNNVTNTYRGHGTTSWIVKECAYSPTVDDLKYGVCNYIAPTLPSVPEENPNKTSVYLTSLNHTGNAELKAGGNYKTITGIITDSDGNTFDKIGIFEIITIDELNPFVKSTIVGNTLKIKILDNESVIAGIVRVKFATLNGESSTYSDFTIVSNY